MEIERPPEVKVLYFRQQSRAKLYKRNATKVELLKTLPDGAGLRIVVEIQSRTIV